jgi:hypothetical protein
MTQPLLSKNAILAAKIETTVGTAISLATGDTSFLVQNMQDTITVEMMERMGQGGFADIPDQVGRMSAEVSFDIDCSFSANPKTLPAWASTFLPACGLVWDATDTFNVFSAPPSVSGVKSITIGVYKYGTVHIIRGCMGNVIFKGTSGQPTVASFTFKGVYAGRSNAAILAQTFPAAYAPMKYNLATFNAVDYKSASYELDLGNDVQLRECQEVVEGYHSAIVASRKPRITLDVEASDDGTTGLTGFYNKLITMTTYGCTIKNKDVGANFMNFILPAAQVIEALDKNRNGIAAQDVRLKACVSAVIDDELEILIVDGSA